MTIVYCINSTEPSYGGTEVVTVMKANALAEIPGNKVWIAVTDQLKNSTRNVSSKVNVVDLNIDYYDDNNLWKILKSYTIKRWRHKRELQRTMNKIEPDVVISTGQMEKYMIPRIKYKKRPLLVRELHYSTRFRILNANNNIQLLIAKFINWYDYKYRINEYDKIVLLTEEDRQKEWANNKKVIVVPNPLCSNSMLNIENLYGIGKREKIMVAVGRLVSVKNFHSAIRVWKRIVNIHHDWVLQIWGEGSERKSLEELIEKLSLDKNVKLMGYTPNVLEKMKCASALIATSLHEGFCMTIIEGMSMGLPVVSYSFPCGPKDIISDGIDGFLVSLGDEQLMANEICRLIEDEELRNQMAHSAMEKAQKYKLERIIPIWMNLFLKNR